MGIEIINKINLFKAHSIPCFRSEGVVCNFYVFKFYFLKGSVCLITDCSRSLPQFLENLRVFHLEFCLYLDGILKCLNFQLFLSNHCKVRISSQIPIVSDSILTLLILYRWSKTLSFFTSYLSSLYIAWTKHTYTWPPLLSVPFQGFLFYCQS